MLKTYKAMLKGNNLEWIEEAPPVRSNTPLKVLITVLERGDADGFSRGPKMGALLDKLSESKTFKAIKDPVEWQHTLRRDTKQLPDALS